MSEHEPAPHRERAKHRVTAGPDHLITADAMPVPGRVRPPAAPLSTAGQAASALRSARGALHRVALGVAQLEATIREGRPASPMLALDVRSALTRAEVALAQADEIAPAAELRAARALQAELAPRAEAALAAQEALATPDAVAVALAADVATMGSRLGLGRVDVRADAGARSITDAHAARGIALGDTVYLHPEQLVPGSTEAREVVAHELVHLAQARLALDDASPEGRDDAEAEAAALAPRLAGGEAVEPRRYIDLSRPAADRHGRKPHAPAAAAKPGLDAVGNAAVMVGDAAMEWQRIAQQYAANESADVASFELVPELASLGKALWDARREALSDSTLPEARKQLVPELLGSIDDIAKQVEALEVTIRGASETAEVLGDPTPAAPARREVTMSDGPVSGRDAQMYIASTPVVADAIRRGPKGAGFGKAEVRFYDDAEAFIQVYVDAFVITEGLTDAQAKKAIAVGRAKAAADAGFTDPLRHVVHVLRPVSDPSTTIHELMHLYICEPSVMVMGGSMHEGLADFATRMVCDANQLPFRAAYDGQVLALDWLAAQVGAAALIEFAFVDSKTLPAILDSKGAGTWDALKAAFEAQEFLAVPAIVKGLTEANQRREATERARMKAEAKAEQAAADEKAKAAHAGDPPESEWPDAESVSIRIANLEPDKSPPYIELRIGGNKGIRVGWQATVPMSNGATVTLPVTEVHFRTCRIGLPDHETAVMVDSRQSVDLRRPQ